MSMYSGYLDVEPNEFSLRMDRMSVKNKKISFDCYGRVREDGSKYSFSGTAFKQPEGHYKVDRVEQEDGVEFETSIYIVKAKCSVDNCYVEGFWYEKWEGDEAGVYRFSGSLEPF